MILFYFGYIKCLTDIIKENIFKLLHHWKPKTCIFVSIINIELWFKWFTINFMFSTDHWKFSRINIWEFLQWIWSSVLTFMWVVSLPDVVITEVTIVERISTHPSTFSQLELNISTWKYPFWFKHVFYSW